MQVKSGLGLGDQRAKVTAMATVKGWPEPVFYVDEGLSGTKESSDRPHLARMMAAVKAGEIDAVIINSIDRLARKARLTLELMDELGRNGVILVSCKENIDTTTPAGQLVVTVLAAIAQLERDMIAERTRAALAEHSRRDGESGGRLPYGYVRIEQGKLGVDPAQARVIRRIFKLRAEHLTLRQIADALNRRKYPSPQGKHWHHSSVAAVLANADYYLGGLRGASVLRWPVILKDPVVYVIAGTVYPRVCARTDACHDCGARTGEFHLQGCDMEQCPRCGGQFISCDCEKSPPR